MGRAGSPIYKGEPGDYDLPFVRSFQLFCPIKISIFSPIAATLSRVRLLQCRSLPLPLPLPPAFRPFLSGHPPYGNIDRAQPRDSSPSHPRPSWYTATAFSLSLFLSVSLSLPPLLSLSLSLSPPTLFRLQYSIIGYASARGPFAKSGKRSRLRFLRAHKRARVVFTALLRLPSDCATERREIEERRENGKG